MLCPGLEDGRAAVIPAVSHSADWTCAATPRPLSGIPESRPNTHTLAFAQC